MISFAFTPLVMLLTFYVYKAKSPGLDTVSSLQPFGYFTVGIFLLAIIIIGIASFIEQKNRDVILLKHRITEIYLSALRQSALNPELESSTSHD